LPEWAGSVGLTDHSTTVRLQQCLDRLQAGDVIAREELVNCACERLERLTRKMLRDYPGVRRYEETSDVRQNASVRLWRSLQEVSPPCVRDFFRLAALHIRRELIDLARHHFGPESSGAHHATPGPAKDVGAESATPPAYEKVDSADGPEQLAVWEEFHRQADALPDEEREVFDLLWYQGLAQAEAATLLGVSERTVKRRWQAARLKLHEALKGELPPL
jgi:RNA polymerase sigma factor (sigma-70 family)